MSHDEENKIKAVIFDIGGVYLKGSRKDIYSSLSEQSEVDFEFIKSQLNKFYTELEDTDFFWRKIADILKQKDYGKVRKIWLEAVEKKFVVNKKVKEIIENLKKSNYKIAALTDTNIVHSTFIKKMGYYKPFDVVILSSEVGVKKPDIKIYKIVTEKLLLKPKECIYIDDNKRNLIPAKKLGMKTILFKNAKQLENELNKLGILN